MAPNGGQGDSDGGIVTNDGTKQHLPNPDTDADTIEQLTERANALMSESPATPADLGNTEDTNKPAANLTDCPDHELAVMHATAVKTDNKEACLATGPEIDRRVQAGSTAASSEARRLLSE